MTSNKKAIEIIVFAVGSGDCIHVQQYGNDIDEEKHLLIDTGFKRDYLRIKEKIEKKNKRIDSILITHNHLDHISGLSNFLDDRDFNIRRVFYWAKDIHPGPTMNQRLQHLLLKALSRDIDIVSLESSVRGLNQYFGDSMKVLHPMGDLEFKNSPNNDSVVVAIQLENKNLLLMGDATITEETVIINRGTGPDLTNTALVKIGHHGSASSSSSSFISYLSQKEQMYAVCSCKSNRDSCPPDPSKLEEIQSIIEEPNGGKKLYLTGEEKKAQDVIISIMINGDVNVEEELVP